MWMIVGLGNPGAQYANNRHNVGFMLVDALARELNADAFKSKFSAEWCKARGKGVVLTLDHVTPRCQGGKNSWENLATSCFACNNKKGGRNLEESGMVLTPVPPRPAEVVAFRASMFRRLGMSCPSWDKYLPTAS